MLPAAPQSSHTAAPAQQHHPLALPLVLLLLLLLLLLLPAVDLALALLRQ
jgi:hypothetical protein